MVRLIHVCRAAAGNAHGDTLTCAGLTQALDRLYRARGWQPLPVREELWPSQASPAEQQAHLRSLLPAEALQGMA